MKITTQGNGIKIGKRLEEKIAGKLAKFDKYFGEEGSFNIKIHPEKELKKVEITLKLQNHIFRAEAKDEDILNAVVERIPHPKGDEDAPLQALIFDSVFNSFRGIIAYFKIENGVMYPSEKVRFFNTQREYFAEEIGVDINSGEDISLMKIIANYHPVVIVDESHNAVSDLPIEMLEALDKARTDFYR